MFGREVVTPQELLLSPPLVASTDVQHHISLLQTNLKFAFEKVRENVHNEQLLYKKYYDVHRRDVEFEIGQKVWRNFFAYSSKEKNIVAKFLPRRIGPSTIIRKISPLVYEIREDSNGVVSIENIANLTPYVHVDLQQVSSSESENSVNDDNISFHNLNHEHVTAQSSVCLDAVQPEGASTEDVEGAVGAASLVPLDDVFEDQQSDVSSVSSVRGRLRRNRHQSVRVRSPPHLNFWPTAATGAIPKRRGRRRTSYSSSGSG
jgi:hypothetical protein